MKATDKKDSDIRELYFSNEFLEFYDKLQDKIKTKFEHTMDIIRTEYVLSTKFVKHLENTDLYEMRVSVSTNEYRTILFAVDNDNIILSKRILLLNGFLKKSTKDYSKQIKIAKRILEEFEL
ncbi:MULTISPECIES: type II toxin-antitoxin system RelE/ParE family toxin [Butyricimonas]|uniref:type II toxin-antitoxin system RelE/ParE family toxin n=1 Tax=Butyricimonas TaxID=574697 RepID=UPI001D06F455|nr:MULTISPECIES: type II toxin-antitoxin system RelE/ParE family toxin [Butyricimonas]MCB6974967.1 type II toxin-antitoxin system RelE/ParE family toxin [Butyricimonas synergistica]MCG4521671.1 type II toxin-antitoxin system RelE/ParE family toxin [Butyricimonas sp. DFI.6.44]